MESFDDALVRSTQRDPAPTLGFTRLRRGIHVNAEEWAAQHVDGRQRLRAHAVAASARRPPVYSHLTAAALWHVPVFGSRDTRAHVIEPGENPPKSRGDVVRHSIPLPDDDVVMLDGLLVTVLDRTVYDVIRTLPPEGGLAAFDAALRRVAWDDAAHTIDAAASDGFRALVWRRIFANPGARGIRRARLLAELADGRAQLPGESVSRYRMWELGMPAPDLQRQVMTDLGWAYLDFAWPRLRRFGEFDGAVKLVNPEFTRGRTPAQVVRDQLARRAAIENATGWTGMNWGMPQLDDCAAFLSALTEQGWPRGYRP
ncbi:MULTISPECIES: hypothetical protein [unclassified Microbacterium]|uniref:hypothetical protein n=1 Tax=unclassified Microbacterium TaxID=2609290 RepID=UPI00214B5CC5|nr:MULTISPECIES: hypothetical protein [unclassified Microbacterium]MCR2808824.1 hypothetical protein [Microbacterium sp. zg.B185]WIM18754.1 hypothetical protein QNO12_14355 [Microbacterium sp. zg-B185]